MLIPDTDRRAGIGLVGGLCVLLLAQVAIPTHAQAFDPPPAPATGTGIPADTAITTAILRRGGESCFFGAGTGAASILLSSIQMPTGGMAASGLFGLALGAAGFGCAVGFVGATAATGFSYFWDQKVDPRPRDTTGAPEAGPARP